MALLTADTVLLTADSILYTADALSDGGGSGGAETLRADNGELTADSIFYTADAIYLLSGDPATLRADNGELTADSVFYTADAIYLVIPPIAPPVPPEPIIIPEATTALEIIEDALGLTNSVGSDQTLTAKETSDCLRAFNDLLEDWSLQNLAVYGMATQTFNTIAGLSVYTIGPGGTWNTTRPVRVSFAAYSMFDGATMPLVKMSQAEYDSIAVKSQTQEFPSQFLFVNTSPLAQITLYPVPSAVTPITLAIDRVLPYVASAGTSITFPTGYRNGFVYALAVKLAPKFGKKMTNYPEIVAEANRSLGNIKRANKTLRTLAVDPMFGDTRGGGFGYWRN